MGEIKLRMACLDDAEGIVNVYRPYVLETTITFEYDVPSVEEYRQRIKNVLVKYPFLIAEMDGEIVGFSYASAFKGRAAYDWSVETSIYVSMDCKRLGIGKMLYTKLEEILKLMNIQNMNACITYPNPKSKAFHEAMGFKKAAHFDKCGYKFGEWHDMMWMEKHIGKHENNPAKVIAVGELKNKTDKIFD